MVGEEEERQAQKQWRLSHKMELAEKAKVAIATYESEGYVMVYMARQNGSPAWIGGWGCHSP